MNIDNADLENNARRIFMDPKIIKKINIKLLNKKIACAKYMEEDFISGDIQEYYSENKIHNTSIFAKNNSQILDITYDKDTKIETVSDFVANTTIIKSNENK